MSFAQASGSSKRTKVFIQYTKADIVFADALNVALTRIGFLVLMDRRDVVVDDWQARLDSLFTESDVVLNIRSQEAMDSPIAGAWTLDRARELGKRIVPVVPRQAKGPPRAGAYD